MLLCILFGRDAEVSGQTKLSISSLKIYTGSKSICNVMQELACLKTGATLNFQLLLFKLISLPNKSSLTLLPL